MDSAVVIVDYGMGNIRSLARALERAGAAVVVSDDPSTIDRASRLVIPGQGAFGQAMERLHARSIAPVLRDAIASRRPILGICLGLQILFQGSEEAPGVPGLGVLPGMVRLLSIGPGLKRPHMGWAPVEHLGDHPVLSANKSGEAFYFVHSYAPMNAPNMDPRPPLLRLPLDSGAGGRVNMSRATTKHAEIFVAAVARGSLVATQFHPEKSQDAGERLLRAWLSLR
jgi:imidazole glycerol phosphate synthase glutamine amidotransferase subunit